jgi:AGZA family xanthine/uracil permease-like MFS transporter
MPSESSVGAKNYNWAAPGDVNAFFGLALDNIAGMVLMVSMLSEVFGFPAEFALRYMIPGTALGVLIGDLMYFCLAFPLAKRLGRNVTAMPLGLDTPSTIWMVLFVLGPAFAEARGQGLDQTAAATMAWHIGIGSIFLTGLIKLVFSFAAGAARRLFPRAGLLGSLAAIALVLIAFMPLLDVMAMPIVGLSSLAVILVTLVARSQLPFRFPGAAGAVVVSVGLFYLIDGVSRAFGVAWQPEASVAFNPARGLLPREWMSVFSGEWFSSLGHTLKYLPYIIPFSITTVIGGIDCTESAASVGDEYRTGRIIGVEAIATIGAALCGGVIQTTPYIGHPAYKMMGARALYTLLTALFVGGAGLLGYFGYIYLIIPKAALLPILIFVGLEITAQSYIATPRRHYAALALACLPAAAKLVSILVIGPIKEVEFRGITLDQFQPKTQEQLSVIFVLAGGFIVSSLLWASAMAEIIDRRLYRGALFFLVCALGTLFGVIHSPFIGDDKMFWPWTLDAEHFSTVIQLAIAYVIVAALLIGLGYWQRNGVQKISSDEEFERLG